ncbi:uncharacterized protein V1513DRAFT_441550 [Lipomyces chichibuensis]|uniref:uncharacterized protein n=1 Tax=Lipomyces chichibuensis TaxID=1546026 RepID=UPI0033439734
MATMDQAEVIIRDNVGSSSTSFSCSVQYKLVFPSEAEKSKPNPKRTEFDLHESYKNHEDFFEAVSLFMELHGNHRFEAAVQPLRMKVTLNVDLSNRERHLHGHVCTKSGPESAEASCSDYLE